jgi:phage gp29-like protein
LVYTDDVNILGRSIHTINKNAKDVVVASMEIELQVNADKTKYLVMSRNQNADEVTM